MWDPQLRGKMNVAAINGGTPPDPLESLTKSCRISQDPGCSQVEWFPLNTAIWKRSSSDPENWIPLKNDSENRNVSKMILKTRSRKNVPCKQKWWNETSDPEKRSCRISKSWNVNRIRIGSRSHPQQEHPRRSPPLDLPRISAGSRQDPAGSLKIPAWCARTRRKHTDKRHRN